MREVVLDTETTGLDAAGGDRIIEIGGIELINHIPSGREYHVYINPQRKVSAGAYDVHGIGNDFLADKPLFDEIAEEFLTFIEGADLVIHNAPFDVGFLNAELTRVNKEPIPEHRVIDTLAMARRRHPGSPNSLDALCRRYNVDNSTRGKHGALLDANLLAEVYIELIGGRQAYLTLTSETTQHARGSTAQADFARPRPEPLPIRLTEEEMSAHTRQIARLGDRALWLRYGASQSGEP